MLKCFIILPITLLLCILQHSIASTENLNVVVLIVAQKNQVHEKRALDLRSKLIQSKQFSTVLIDSLDFFDVIGGWAIWPIITSLCKSLDESNSSPDWLLIVEDETEINSLNLIDLLKSYNSREKWFLGYGLKDQSPTIIHHYANVDSANPFLYPDFAAGVVFSWPAVELLRERIMAKGTRDFTIDSKHELATLLYNEGKGVRLTHGDEFCLLGDSLEIACSTSYSPAINSCPDSLTADDVVFAVKTFTGNHKSRIVVVKRTWAKQTLNIEYFSDTVDNYIPTIDLGINNTDRGHCGKTMAIISRFKEWKSKKWLVIADDDTILSIPRLLKLLSCYNPVDSIVLGERYAYGLQGSGRGGYEYPTGGSSMIFSATAAMSLAKDCSCPSDDSPDDMILGMCLRRMNLPVLHSPALHQARPPDYSEDYLKRIAPISFHKHWEIDPYQVYTQYLQTGDDKIKMKEEL